MIVTRRHSTECRRHYSMLLVTNAIHHDQATHLIVGIKPIFVPIFSRDSHFGP